MKALFRFGLFLAILLLAMDLAQAHFCHLKVKAHWKSHVNGTWDYAVINPVNRHLLVARGQGIQAFSLDDGKDLGIVVAGNHMHGIAFAGDKGIATSGDSNQAIVFDTKSYEVLGKVDTGANPDAVVIEPKTGLAVVLDGKSNQASVVSLKMPDRLYTVSLPGKPEFAVADGSGRVFVNIEDRNAVAVLDIEAKTVTAERPLPGCEEPSGLALDPNEGHLFSVCSNGVMDVTNVQTGAMVAQLPIGKKPDAAVFDPVKKRVYSANGDGTLTVVQQKNSTQYRVLKTIATAKNARTMAFDSENQKAYLPSAVTFSMKGMIHPRMIPGTFRILVVGR